VFAWAKDVGASKRNVRTITTALSHDLVWGRLKRRAISEGETRRKLILSRLGLSDWFRDVFEKKWGIFTHEHRVCITVLHLKDERFFFII
jgi:hypothetical protein